MGLFDSVGKAVGSISPLGGIDDFLVGAGLLPGDVSTPGISGSEQEILDKWKTYLFNLADTQPEIYKQLQGVIGQDPFKLNAEQITGLQDVFGLQQQRLTGALRGEADFDPGLERDIADFERVAGEATRRQLGPNFLRSSAGPAAFGRLKETGLIARDRARRAEIQGGTQNLLGLAGGITGVQGAGLAAQGQRFNQLRSLFNPQGLSAGFSGLLNPFTNYNLLPFQADLFNQRQRQQTTSDIIGLGGQLGAAAIAA